MYKFFVTQKQMKDGHIYITGEDVNHIKNVLRLTPGEKLLICNTDMAKTYITKITKITQEEVIAQNQGICEETTESNINLHIFQGLPKQEKMEQIIQKLTELGVNDIIPVKMERCIVKLDEKTAQKKCQRWQKIIEGAAKQSKRDKIPNIHEPLSLKQVYEKLKNYELVIIAYEEETKHTIRQILKQYQGKLPQTIAVLVGPEGGITKEEITILQSLPNSEVVTLGKRILRTETAPIVLASIIMYEGNEME